MPHGEGQQNKKDGRSIKGPEAPFVALQILQPVVAIVRNLHCAINGSQRDQDGREVDSVREFPPEMQVAEIVSRPTPRDVEVAHGDDGESDKTQHLQDKAQDEYHTSWQRFSLRGADGAATRGIMVVLPTNLRRADELD